MVKHKNQQYRKYSLKKKKYNIILTNLLCELLKSHLFFVKISLSKQKSELVWLTSIE